MRKLSDFISVLFSGIALMISVISFYQSSADKTISLRSQFTDLINQMTEIDIKAITVSAPGQIMSVPVNNNQQAPDNSIYEKNRILGNQKLLLADLAGDISRNISHLITPLEYQVIASAYSNMGRFNDAKYFYEQSLEAAKRTKRNPDIAYTYMNIGFFYSSIGKMIKTRESFDMALKVIDSDSPLDGDTNLNSFIKGQIYEGWFDSEARNCSEDANSKYNSAKKAYSSISDAPARESNLFRLEEHSKFADSSYSPVCVRARM